MTRVQDSVSVAPILLGLRPHDIACLRWIPQLRRLLNVTHLRWVRHAWLLHHIVHWRWRRLHVRLTVDHPWRWRRMNYYRCRRTFYVDRLTGDGHIPFWSSRRCAISILGTGCLRWSERVVGITITRRQPEGQQCRRKQCQPDEQAIASLAFLRQQGYC